ncbi:MAG: DUF899 family protein [Armatimonadota bacterium]|nr:DUF899 family protein [Armatimonadota bacterium]
MNDTIKGLEKQILELKGQLAEARKETEPEPVENYSFATVDGAKSLDEMFAGMDDMLVIHNMGKSCNYCSMWADGIDGYFPHLAGRAAVVLISPDDPATQRTFAEERGWRFPTASDADGGFTRKMGFLNDTDGYWPGVSALHKAEDGSITRKNYAIFGPGDDFCPVWPLLELLQDGQKGWEPPH